jgi:hypothetical protein
MRASSLAFAVLALPIALTACPQFTSDWTLSGVASLDGGGEGGGHDAARSGDTGGETGGSGDAVVLDSYSCTPGATQCTSETQLETCETNGQWGTATTCTYACLGYVGGYCGGVCIPNTTRCTSDTHVETCSMTGQWGAATTCTYACLGADDGGVGGNCGGACIPGAMQCSNSSQIQTCDNTGTWQNTTTCTPPNSCQTIPTVYCGG